MAPTFSFRPRYQDQDQGNFFKISVAFLRSRSVTLLRSRRIFKNQDFLARLLSFRRHLLITLLVLWSHFLKSKTFFSKTTPTPKDLGEALFHFLPIFFRQPHFYQKPQPHHSLPLD